MSIHSIFPKSKSQSPPRPVECPPSKEHKPPRKQHSSRDTDRVIHKSPKPKKSDGEHHSDKECASNKVLCNTEKQGQNQDRDYRIVRSKSRMIDVQDLLFEIKEDPEIPNKGNNHLAPIAKTLEIKEGTLKTIPPPLPEKDYTEYFSSKPSSTSSNWKKPNAANDNIKNTNNKLMSSSVNFKMSH